MGRTFNVPFIQENRGGASGTIGAEAVAPATPDDYMLLYTPHSALNVLPQQRKAGYDPVKYFMPVSRIDDLVGGVVTQSSVNITTMSELVSYAKANPGKLI